MEWTNEFIELYSKKPSLWDPESKLYKIALISTEMS